VSAAVQTLRALVGRVRRSDVVRHGVLVLVATTLGNLLSFLYHAAVSRILGVAAYGALYALISLAQLEGLPGGFLPSVIARYAAEFAALDDEAHLRALSAWVARLFGAVACAYLAVSALFAVPIARYLHVAAWTVPLTGAIAGIGMLSIALRSVLQGAQDFTTYSAASIGEGAGKVGFGALLARAGFGVGGGLVGFLAGSCVSAAIAAERLRRRYRGVERVPLRIDWRRVIETTGAAAAATIAGTIFSSADVVLVRHYFSPRDAGLYAAVALAGKIMLFVVGFAPTVLLPKATERHARGESSRNALFAMLAMLAVIGAAGLAVFCFAGRLVLHALVGSAFDAALPLLPWYALAMLLLAFSSAMASYGIALHRLSFAVPMLLAAFAEIVAIAVYHPSLAGVVTVVVAANGLALAATVVGTGRAGRRAHVA